MQESATIHLNLCPPPPPRFLCALAPWRAIFVHCLLLASMSAVADADEAAAQKQELHVSSQGSDENGGTPEAPLRTPAEAVKRLKENGTAILHDGTFPIDASINLAVKGITIRGAENAAGNEGGRVILQRGDYQGTTFTVSAEGVTIEGLVLDGGFVTKSRAIIGKKSGGKLTIRKCEIRRFTDHAVDLDGDDARVEECHIHHNLLWNAARKGPDDAHGVVTMYSQRLLIKNCTIDHVSGDCFQGDRGGWQDVTIEDCDFSNGTLEEDMAGFREGASPGEDGIDTKLAAGKERARLIVRRTKFHDFHSSFISTPAALNLKESIDAVVDGCDISDSVVALRLRGTGRGVMRPTVINCTIHNCGVAVRYEDNLQDFHFAHNTLALNRRLFQPAPENTPYGKGWIVANNLFVDVGRLPRETASGKNSVLPLKSVDKDTLRPATPNLKPLEGKPLEGLVPEWYASRIEFDHSGRERSKEVPTLGAYEAP